MSTSHHWSATSSFSQLVLNLITALHGAIYGGLYKRRELNGAFALKKAKVQSIMVVHDTMVAFLHTFLEFFVETTEFSSKN